VIDDDFGVGLELALFASNIRKSFALFWNLSFFSKKT
jgi:hypothetical protein